MKEDRVTINLTNNYGRVLKKITGDLDSVVLFLPYKCEVLIFSELGYNIFTARDLKGVLHIPIRIQAYDSLGHRISFSAEKYKLNEKLIIAVKTYEGKKGEKQEVKLLLRYD